MICQNCDGPIELLDERCPRCGAKPLHRRVFFGEKPEEFTLQPEEESSEFVLDLESDGPTQVALERTQAEAYGRPQPRAPVPQVAWGGFLRRAVAFVLDLVVVVALAAVLSLLSYIGYSVGLAAHDQALTMTTARPLVLFVALGCIALAAGYFVLLHGMEGKTVGKWMFGLRVVGPQRAPVSYGQVFLRCLGMVVFAPLMLGFLWVIWSREKRAWHDFLAGTWVIRD
jgi:uncharacterized RDD family membrane protein YckC